MDTIFRQSLKINRDGAADVNRLMRIFTFVMALFLTTSAQAEQAGPSLLFDAETGALISQNRAGELWYPASLTKLMTAYVVFDKIREGKLRLDQQIPVSKLANAQEPSKIGVPPGQTVSVDFALQSLLVYSANDMAYVLAEAASGSAAAFADDMNAVSKRAGLTATHFVNPNGLFDPRHVTSARDIGMIAALIIGQYPQYQHYFSQPYVQVGKRRLSNRNSLIRMMPDADGMKTGFVCNSGFNLVASATRNGRRLVAVVLGTRSGFARAQQAQQLLESGFQLPVPAVGADNVAEIKNVETPIASITDMTGTVCPRKQAVLYASLDKLEGHAVVLGFYDTAVEADRVLRQKLVEASGMELAGTGGVVQMPNKGRFAALVWGLDADESQSYCELTGADVSACRVYGPDFLADLVTAKQVEQPAPPVAQGSDGIRKSAVRPARLAKARTARRVKRVLKARRKLH